MPAIIFKHPKVGNDLIITTGANEVSWSYNLNTVSYPTYGGEVVQVLSANIDQLSISGEITSYQKMEAIYEWFVKYFTVATQGVGQVNYVETPVMMEYPHRGWSLHIQPIAMPAMSYGRDIVIPTWSMQAHIINPDPDQQKLVLEQVKAGVKIQGTAQYGGLEEFVARGTLTAKMPDPMFRVRSPFSDPWSLISEDESQTFFKDTKIEMPQGVTVAGSKTDKGARAIPESKDVTSLTKYVTDLGKQMQEQFKKLMDAEQVELIWGDGASSPTSDDKTDDTKDKDATTKSTKTTKGTTKDTKDADK